jgi:hypothetical protein
VLARQDSVNIRESSYAIPVIDDASDEEESGGAIAALLSPFNSNAVIQYWIDMSSRVNAIDLPGLVFPSTGVSASVSEMLLRVSLEERYAIGERHHRQIGMRFKSILLPARYRRQTYYSDKVCQMRRMKNRLISGRRD